MGGNSRRNLHMFHKLCGSKSLQNVIIITTMWDKVTLEEGSQREQELMSSNKLFKPWLEGKAIMMRHERTTRTANEALSLLLAKGATSTQIAHELIKEEKTLEETAAGRELYSEINELMKKHEREMESLKTDLRREFAEERRIMDQRMAKLLKELNELKRGITIVQIAGYVSLTNTTIYNSHVSLPVDA